MTQDDQRAPSARGAEVLEQEAAAIARLAERLRTGTEGADGAFGAAVALVLGCRGQVVVTGMGKAGLIGQKISATLASTEYYITTTRRYVAQLAELISIFLCCFGQHIIIMLLPSTERLHVHAHICIRTKPARTQPCLTHSLTICGAGADRQIRGLLDIRPRLPPA